MDNSDYFTCSMTANTDITLLSCNANAYAYKTSDLLNGNQQQTSQSKYNLSIPILPLSAVRANNEINKMGSVTFFNQSNYQAYRISLANGSIIQEQLFTIDQRAIGSTNSVDDLLITRDMVIVKFSNSTFYSFKRPQQANLVLYNPQAARINYTQVQQLTFQFVQVDQLMQNYYLYSSPNFDQSNNVLYQHIIQPKYTNGAISDVQITLLNTYNIKDLIISAIEFTTNITAIGCQNCNSYVGRVEFYDRQTFTLLRLISGTSDNMQMGQVIESYDNGDQLIFYVGSSTSGSQNSRQYYLNAVMFQKFSSNSSLGYQVITQAVRNLVSLPQNGILTGMIGNQMIIKYTGNKLILSVQSCSKNSYYTLGTCQACSQSDYPFQLSIQSTKCSNCSDIWYSEQKQQSTTYWDALYDNYCQSFDPTTLPDYQNYNNSNGNGNQNGNGNGNNNQTNNGGGNNTSSTSSDGSGSGLSGGSIAGIVIGVIAILVIAGVIGYCIYKKKLKDQESQEVREKRQQKQKDKLEKANASAAANNNSKANSNKSKDKIDQQSKRIQRKMEKEVYDNVKQKDKEKEEKQKQQDVSTAIVKNQNFESANTSKMLNNNLSVKTGVNFLSGKRNFESPLHPNLTDSQFIQGPGDIENQIKPIAAAIGNVGSSFKKQEQQNKQQNPKGNYVQAISKPGGEINDPNDIDVEISDDNSNYSGSVDEGEDDNDYDYDGSEISQERDNPPQRINNIQNKQKQPTSTIAKNNNNNNSHNRNKSEGQANVNSERQQQQINTNSIQPSQVKQGGVSSSPPKKNNNNDNNISKVNNSDLINKSKLKQQEKVIINTQNSNGSGNSSDDRLEERKSDSSQPSTQEKRHKTINNNNNNAGKAHANANNSGNGVQRKQFYQNDDSADIIEDEDDSFTDSDDESK